MLFKNMYTKIKLLFIINITDKASSFNKSVTSVAEPELEQVKMSRLSKHLN